MRHCTCNHAKRGSTVPNLLTSDRPRFNPLCGKEGSIGLSLEKITPEGCAEL